jgi:hypothetical protein
VCPGLDAGDTFPAIGTVFVYSANGLVGGRQDWQASSENGTVWDKKLVLEMAKRNAKMVAGWQVYSVTPPLCVWRARTDANLQVRVYTWRNQHSQVNVFWYRQLDRV